MPKVSVVLCSYNQAQYLEQSIASVFSQTHDDVELVLVDNGSTDDSQAIMKRYESDPRVKLVLFPQNGVIGNRLNAGLRASTGDFISILYSDDYYLPHKLASQVKMFEKLGPEYGVVYSPGIRLDIDTNEQWLDPCPGLSGNVLRRLLSEDAIIHPVSPLVRRECFDRYPFLEDIFVEGEGIFIRMAMKYLFHFDAEATCVMRDTKNNSGRAVKRNVEITFICIDKLEKDPDFPASELPTLRSMRIKVTRQAAWIGIRMMNDGAWARAMAVKAIKLHPKLLFDAKTVTTLALSIAPKPAVSALNKVADRLLKVRGHSNVVAEDRVA